MIKKQILTALMALSLTTACSTLQAKREPENLSQENASLKKKSSSSNNSYLWENTPDFAKSLMEQLKKEDSYLSRGFEFLKNDPKLLAIPGFIYIMIALYETQDLIESKNAKIIRRFDDMERKLHSKPKASEEEIHKNLFINLQEYCFDEAIEKDKYNQEFCDVVNNYNSETTHDPQFNTKEKEIEVQKQGCRPEDFSALTDNAHWESHFFQCNPQACTLDVNKKADLKKREKMVLKAFGESEGATYKNTKKALKDAKNKKLLPYEQERQNLENDPVYQKTKIVNAGCKQPF